MLSSKMSGSASGYLLNKPLSRIRNKRPSTEVIAGYSNHFLCFHSLVPMMSVALSGPKSFLKKEQNLVLSEEADKTKRKGG